MILKTKNLLKKWLFKQEMAKFASTQARLDNTTIDQVLFSKLKGFNPHLVDGVNVTVGPQGQIDVDADIFDDVKKLGYTRENFLAESKRLADNWVFPVICDYFIRNQTVVSFRTSKSADETNFGRAIVLAIDMLRDEPKRLAAIFEQSKQPAEEFDKSSVT